MHTPGERTEQKVCVKPATRNILNELNRQQSVRTPKGDSTQRDYVDLATLRVRTRKK